MNFRVTLILTIRMVLDIHVFSIQLFFMKLLLTHRQMNNNNIFYLKLFQHAHTYIHLKNPIKSDHIPVRFCGGHHHHQGQSKSTSQDTAIVNCLILRTQSQIHFDSPMNTVPLYLLMGDAKWI
jgi:hypothetical protein